MSVSLSLCLLSCYYQYMKSYVITKMFTGGYLDDNLGHEYINLFKTDQGESYVYVTALGYINSEYDDTVEGVILTRHIAKGCQEVLGIAITAGGEQISRGIKATTSKKQNIEQSARQTFDYLKTHEVTYGGADLYQLYGSDNEWGISGGRLTFRAKKLLVPKQKMLIFDSKMKDQKWMDKDFLLPDKGFGSSAMHIYITDKDNPKSFDAVSKLIQNEALWEEGKAKIDKNRKLTDDHFNFLNIIRKENDELVFSNMLAYFLMEDRRMLTEFSKEVLGVEIDERAEIIREQDNIDILISDKNNEIVIENKLKSDINGVDKRHNFSDGHLIQSQLLKYYNLTEKRTRESGKRGWYFVFLPNYSRIDISKYEGSKYYQEVRYSELYNFFIKYDNKEGYFHEFTKALFGHTKDRDSDTYERMERLFLKKIQKKNTN